MCYTQRKIQGGVGALKESNARNNNKLFIPWSNDTNFLKLNGQSRNLKICGFTAGSMRTLRHC